ncbi:TAXI family TRAP transporter solute-binding subunit [Marinimicrococcus flavescens]|uniref:TAXI family TRAP transporter solute-binding subunit n=1 Tax=Marinimicrococcus flavescens TaxID=3031815 RepID=A0AAP3V013_9PROT|nr:TAXI family TRAP transporter solute-binding subunit [Marinimicrococcus flavescens]
MTKRRGVQQAAFALAALGLAASPAMAETRMTLKSAKAGSSYYVMMVQLAEALKKASDGEVLPTVEESQGSVQNVKEAAVRPGNFLFTSPPSLIDAAAKGEKPFEGSSFEGVRTLFPMPFITIHLVVSETSGIENVEGLAGSQFIAGGKGTFCEGRTKKLLDVLDLTGKVEIVDVELDAASNAMRNGKVDGFATCSSHPTPQLTELATTTPLKVLGLSAEERQKIVSLDPLSGPITIAAGTYKGQDEAVETVGVPVGAYGTTGMDEETAYLVTKSFWDWKDRLAAEQPWWDAVEPALVAQLGATIHPGAARYYREQGVELPESMR